MFPCNIDSRGRRVRFLYGCLMLLAGTLTVIFWAWHGGHWLPWTVSALLLASGVLGLFSARRGWCVARAMGWRTPV